MAFDSEGNLYVTTGDDNSSQSTNGYSGNNQPQAARRATRRRRPTRTAAPTNFAFNDARRTAGNTNNYNGKMLRFNPIDSLADGAKPAVGVGTTYSLPTAASPERPEPVRRHRGRRRQGQARDLRHGPAQPVAHDDRPEDRRPVRGVGRPGRRSPSADAGSVDVRDRRRSCPRAGNYGWPYCMGNKQAYRDRVADGSLRTTNGAGFVNGGPAAARPTAGTTATTSSTTPRTTPASSTLPHTTGTGKDAGTRALQQRLVQPRQPEQRQRLPAVPASSWAPTTRPTTAPHPTQLCPYLTASGATVFTGPVYRYKEGADNSARWPEVLGRPLVPQRLRQQQRQARAAARSRRPTRTARQPVYADSFRGCCRGARTTWTRSSVRTARSTSRSTRASSPPAATPACTASTTRVAPTRRAPTRSGRRRRPRAQVEFSIGASGGVSYEWDFGDGTPASSAANPRTPYAEPGTYTAKLTVTYADGEKASKTTSVTVGDDAVGADDRPRRSTAPRPPAATPRRSSSPCARPTAPAAPASSGSSTASTVARGPGRTTPRNADPFETKFTVSGTGTHTVEYRARDKAGNVSRPGRLGHVRDRLAQRRRLLQRRCRISSTARPSIRSGRSSTRPPATRPPWATAI